MSDKVTKKARSQAGIVRAYKNVFESPDGRKVIADLMRVHGMMSSSFSGDANQTIFKEGERNVVLRILAVLKTDEALLRERIDSHERDLEQI